MQDTLSNIWSKVSVWCLNHEEPREMVVLQNLEQIKTPFYACKPEEGACANRLNLDDYQGLVIRFISEVEKDPFSNFTNYQFMYRGARQKILVRCILYTDKEIRLGVLNQTVLGR